MAFPDFVLKLSTGNGIVVGKDKSTMGKHLTDVIC